MTTKINCPETQGNPKSAQHYSNSLIAQRTRTLKELEEKKQVSTFYFRDHLGICHPAGRIGELRNKGFNIQTHWIVEHDSNGVPHRIALYVLHPNQSNEVSA